MYTKLGYSSLSHETLCMEKKGTKKKWKNIYQEKK